MPLPNILRKASSYILGDCGQDNRRVIYQDGEALFCKNNVCVHPPTLMRQHADVVHHPGYMTITCKLNKNSNLPTLHLSWIPNSTLRKHPTALENLSAKNAMTRRDDDSTTTSPRCRISETATCLDSLNITDVRHELENENENENENDAENDNGNGKLDVCLEAKEPVNCGDCERVCSGSGYSYNYDFLRRRNPAGSNDHSESTEAENRSDSMGSRNEKNEDTKERNLNDGDVRSIDDEPRFAFYDDASIKSRSLSLTSSCSLSISMPTDGTQRHGLVTTV
jgi:hypothetical protein